MLSGPRRSLLADALSNVADVTVQMVADDSSIVPSVLTELNYSIVNGTLDVISSPPPSPPPPPLSPPMHIWPTHAAKVHFWHTTGTAHMVQVMAVIRCPGRLSLFAMQLVALARSGLAQACLLAVVRSKLSSAVLCLIAMLLVTNMCTIDKFRAMHTDMRT